MNNENSEKEKNDRKKENNYLAIALSLGVVFGILADNLALGLALGVAIGCLLDIRKEKKP
ncbi:MAG TPA: hypothetical protein IAA63_10065 [Candidatus Pullilachnospira stercoravium]|uniref:Glycine zipper-like domain-containing protein n=1 Tax=Candidatus Pullilachnospira stercoravium TaxID=2840913 RepID=A0A9D1T6K6_9FIRM|nr:hypothetical protein [Candidatus Pullilachnospira stercoravium]